MNEEPTLDVIDITLTHVAALALATWIYLISKDSEASEIISTAAAKIHAEMSGAEAEQTDDKG